MNHCDCLSQMKKLINRKRVTQTSQWTLPFSNERGPGSLRACMHGALPTPSPISRGVALGFEYNIKRSLLQQMFLAFHGKHHSLSITYSFVIFLSQLTVPYRQNDQELSSRSRSIPLVISRTEQRTYWFLRESEPKQLNTSRGLTTVPGVWHFANLPDPARGAQGRTDNDLSFIYLFIFVRIYENNSLKLLIE